MVGPEATRPVWQSIPPRALYLASRPFDAPAPRPVRW